MRPIARETIEEYLSRGGTITRCSPTARQQHATVTRPDPDRTASSWVRYIAQLINDDQWGAYCSFSLTTTASLNELSRILHRRCLSATNIHNPEPRRRLNREELRKWSRSQLQHRGTLVFLLPATSVLGHQHFHGFIRTPREFASHLLPLRIYEQTQKKELRVPQEVALVFGSARGDHRGNNALRNIHITNDGTRAVLLNDDATARARVLAYWSKTSDGEVRDFTNAHFIPHLVRTALPNANTTKERRVA